VLTVVIVVCVIHRYIPTGTYTRSLIPELNPLYTHSLLPELKEVMCQHFNQNSQQQSQQQVEQVDFDSYRTSAAAVTVAAVVVLAVAVVAILCAFSTCLPRQQQSQREAIVSKCATTTTTSESTSKRTITEVTEATYNNNYKNSTYSVTNWFSNIMGACLSATAPPSIIPEVDGGEDDYHKRYLEDQILGEGEFGVVKMVHDVTAQQNAQQNQNQQQTPYACKLLRKGAVFKDNTLYSPIKPEVLAAEIEILRTLDGQHYCLKMQAIYETRSCLYMVTEFCAGGEMMEYVAAQTTDLRTEDVSRIAFQLLSALDHCAKHGIIHRDIKPENVMFLDPAPGAAVRLIDFGSGCVTKDHKPASNEDGTESLHTTFAGSAFYISPEMFQKTYTYKTDVWSAGATLYVLVAGYPAANLQKAFNILQKATRDLRTLPNLPDNMPDSFYELLDALLTYRHKKRKSAADLVSYEFVRFHEELEAGTLPPHGAADIGVDGMDGGMDSGANNGNGKVDFQLSLEQISATAAGATDPGMNGTSNGTSGRTASVSIRGSVRHHNIFLGFKKYERSLTTLLATLLSKTELNQLLELLKERIGQKIITDQENMNADNVEHTVTEAAMLVSENNKDGTTSNNSKSKSTMDRLQEQKLHVVEIRELKTTLSRDMKNDKMYVTFIRVGGGVVRRSSVCFIGA
jgi:serine/threonine protein kinase